MTSSAETSKAPVATGRVWRLDRVVVPLLLSADVLATLLALVLAFLVRISIPVPLTTDLLPVERGAVLNEAIALVLTTQFPLLYFFGLYDLRLLRSGLNLVVSTVLALGTQLLAISAWYFFRGDLDFPRTVLLLFTLIDILLVATIRLATRSVLQRGHRALRVVLVGPPSGVIDLARMLRAAATAPRTVEVVGAIRSDGPARPGEEIGDGELRWLGSTADLESAARANGVDHVILVPAESWQDALLDRVLRATDVPGAPRVSVVPSVHELLVGRLASLSIEDVPLIEVARDPRKAPGFFIKTIVEYVLAALFLVPALPIVALAGLAIRLTSSGSMLYTQRRVGQGGREFTMYKLRTMHLGAEDATGPVLAQFGDARVTRVGRVLRGLRIDEIPQLLNVLNGTMSLVGPRPERPEFAERLVREIAGYAERWLVKPGLSGLAQVRGEYHTSPTYKLKYDLAYIHNHSLLLDLKIIAETVKALLTRRGV